MAAVIDNSARHRFELEENGKRAFADYRQENDVLVIPHVEADPALRGTGAAGRLMAGILEIARDRGLRIRPVCGYAAAYMDRHPETRDSRA